MNGTETNTMNKNVTLSSLNEQISSLNSDLKSKLQGTMRNGKSINQSVNTSGIKVIYNGKKHKKKKKARLEEV